MPDKKGEKSVTQLQFDKFMFLLYTVRLCVCVSGHSVLRGPDPSSRAAVARRIRRTSFPNQPFPFVEADVLVFRSVRGYFAINKRK